MKLSKIVGFAAGFTPPPLPPDPFRTRWETLRLTRGRWNLLFWGSGNLAECAFDDASGYSLGFPPTERLDVRNLIVRFANDGFRTESDWLGSIPLFYSESEKKISTSMGHLERWLDRAEIDAEGLKYYFDAGYSLFGKTPIRGVRFLRPCELLETTVESLAVTKGKDPFVPTEALPKLSSSEVLGLFRSKIRTLEERIPAKILVPLSGGFDSRMILASLAHPEKVRTATYGLSDSQAESSEVTRASWVARKVGAVWERVPIGGFNRLFDPWNALFGCAVHTHGPYQIEFYRTLLRREGTDLPNVLMSGIVGDAFSGNHEIAPFKGAEEAIRKLSLSHDIRIPAEELRIRGRLMEEPAAIRYWQEKSKQLEAPSYRLVEMIRTKMLLLSYLLSLPEYFGVPCWSPYLELDCVSSFLRLNEEDRRDRKWQRDYFDRAGLSPPIEHLGDTSNTLNIRALETATPPLPSIQLGRWIRLSRLLKIRIILSIYGSVFRSWFGWDRSARWKASAIKAYLHAIVADPISRLTTRSNYGR